MIKEKLWGLFANYLINRAAKTPYFNLEGYMDRTWLIGRDTWLPFTARINKIISSDLDRDMHDHPGWNISIPLINSYKEIMPVDKVEIATTPAHPKDVSINQTGAKYNCAESAIVKQRKPGDIIFRRATDRHKIILDDENKPVWSLFIMQKKATWWGYYVPGFGKVHWTAYSEFLRSRGK